tara:strand:+ start:17072 stop:17233 length:162 start_codon:yes stop_codon:yes gene_type:complete
MEKLIDECIEAHYNMIKHHRRQIIDLCRRKATEDRICMECFDFDIIGKKKSDK